MTTALTTRREDYFAFHRIQVASGDMDPAYPVLRDFTERWASSTEQRLWVVLVFTAYYHLGSALRALQQAQHPRWAGEAALDLPVATERRGHWSRPRLTKHLKAIESIAKEPGGLADHFLRGLSSCTPEDAWRQIQHQAGKIPGNGRWASYKTTELIQQVLGIACAAPDMQHAYSSGPRHGLGLLYANLPEGNNPADIALLDKLSSQLVADMRHHGLRVSVETAETSLCDFHAMVAGRYYPGHDIDQMQLQLTSVPSCFDLYAWDARDRTLPHAYLGERHGRSGIDRSAMIAYRTTGRIPVRTS